MTNEMTKEEEQSTHCLMNGEIKLGGVGMGWDLTAPVGVVQKSSMIR